MPGLRFDNAVLLALAQAGAGTAQSSLSASTDAMKCENISIDFNPTIVQTGEYQASIDDSEELVGGMLCQVAFDVLMKGSGTAATPPEWADLMKGCGWAEVITSTAVPSSAEACGAGGSTTTAELGSSAGTTAQQYRGMPINFSSGQSLSTFITNYTTGKVATLTDTAGGTINAGVNYQIPVNVLYKPASSSFSIFTLWFYMDGKLWKFYDARGNTTFNLVANNPWRLRFTFNAKFVSETDASIVTPTLDTTVAPLWYNGAWKLNRIAAALNSMTLDAQAQVTNFPNPNDAEGFDSAEIVNRHMQGQIDPMERLVATADVMADFRAGTKRIMYAKAGSAAGNRLGLIIPEARSLNATLGQQGGIATRTIPYRAVGADAGAFLTIW